VGYAEEALRKIFPKVDTTFSGYTEMVNFRTRYVADHPLPEAQKGPY
jgi:hypothetical protein